VPVSSGPLTNVARLLEAVPFPWWVAGGWALDLFLGSSIRPRKDLDLAILRRDQGALRDRLSGWDLRVAVPGQGLVEWEINQRLDPPLHEVWARPKGQKQWVCEFLLNEATDSEWIYRRDHRVTMPLADLLTSAAQGVSVLPPEIVLLYKAKEPRPDDELDFRATLPSLDRRAIGWLRGALTMLTPDHAWIDEMTQRRVSRT
jgi:hypothetical protein